VRARARAAIARNFLIAQTRVARVAFAVEDIYLYELARLRPDGALLQSTLLVLGVDARLQRHSLLAAPDAGLSRRASRDAVPGHRHWHRLAGSWCRAAPSRC
jgi:hypothetical protein